MYDYSDYSDSSRGREIAQQALESGDGIVRLAPAWVPRVFCVPGRRIKLHPDDYFAFGANRGGIDERWLSSTTPAENGELTSEGEGLSRIVFDDGSCVSTVTLRSAVSELKGQLIGDDLWRQHECWPMFSKFFDNQGALPHHIHHRQEHASLTGHMSKPEAYFFPTQLNNHPGDFPYTFFGLRAGTTPQQLREVLQNFSKGDNRITDLSQAYRLKPGTGWNVPPGVLHAPGSLCTYEPQKASDVFAMYQSLTGTTVIPEELLWRHTPPERLGDYDFLIEAIDWDQNLDANFARKNFMVPLDAAAPEQMADSGYCEQWICYKSSDFSAKQLTVNPGASVTITDAGAYGLIILQGHGQLGNWPVETPALIRFGQLTMDEFFVSASKAAAGVRITNNSSCEPLVMLKHFGPGNPQCPLDSWGACNSLDN